MYGYEALAVNTYHPDKLPPQHDGQAHTMTVNSNDDELAMGTWYSPEALRAYAAAAVAAERERCAKLCDTHRRSWPMDGPATADTIQAAIRRA